MMEEDEIQGLASSMQGALPTQEARATTPPSIAGNPSHPLADMLVEHFAILDAFHSDTDSKPCHIVQARDAGDRVVFEAECAAGSDNSEMVEMVRGHVPEGGRLVITDTHAPDSKKVEA
jgi:hypothetical protein